MDRQLPLVLGQLAFFSIFCFVLAWACLFVRTGLELEILMPQAPKSEIMGISMPSVGLSVILTL